MNEALTSTNELLESWVDDYADDLYSWAIHKTGKKEISEDLVQDTFFAAVKGVDKFKGDSSAKTWLFSILNNKIIDHYKKTFRNKKNGIEELGDSAFFEDNGNWKENTSDTPWSSDEIELLDNVDFNKAMKSCMELLPDNWHSALSMKFFTEKKGSEICHELGLTETNYWQILRRAKLQLRSCLGSSWFNKNR